MTMSVELKKIWALIHQVAPAMRMSEAEYKERVAELATKRTKSLSGITKQEASEVIKLIEHDASELKLNIATSTDPTRSKRKGKNHNPIFDKDAPEFKMANTVKYYARKLQWTKGEAVDYERLDNWLLSKGMHKKKLNDHTYDELVGLVTQIKAVYESYLRELRKSK